MVHGFGQVSDLFLVLLADDGLNIATHNQATKAVDFECST
jgi:hypothetical protein